MWKNNKTKSAGVLATQENTKKIHDLFMKGIKRGN